MAKIESESPRRATPSGTWSPSPSPPPPPSQPIDLDSFSHQDRIRLLERYGPMRPSELGLPSGSSIRAKNGRKGKEPMVVLSPEELETLVAKQQAGGRSTTDLLNDDAASEDDYGQDEETKDTETAEEDDDDEEPALWEDIANAVLWTIPFGFLFCGMDYAVHRQFGEWLLPAEEFMRILNFLPALFLLNLFLDLSPHRSPLPAATSPLTQSLLSALSITTGLLTIRTTTEEGYLRVMARAPGLGVVWCWTAVRMELGWAVLSLAGVGVGLWWIGADVSWLKSLS